MSIWILLAIVLALLIFMTHPGLNRRRMRRWQGVRLAHRGLHDLDKGIVENTLQAFEAACEAGYGMELDIQFTGDGQVVVFHDDDLLRLTGDPRKIWDVPLSELKAMPLAGREDARIPTFKEVLSAVNGRAPLLIELKNGPHNRQLCEALMAHMKGYPGEYMVESFNPLIVYWFRRHAPQLVRGHRVDGHSHLLAHHVELLYGRRAVDVAGHEQGALVLLGLQHIGKLAAEGGLTRTLQTRHEHYRGPPFELQLHGLTAHELCQLVVDELHHELTGLDGIENVHAHGLLLHLLGERTGHVVVYVGIQQGAANVLQGLGNVYLGYFSFAFKYLKGSLKSVT